MKEKGKARKGRGLSVNRRDLLRGGAAGVALSLLGARAARGQQRPRIVDLTVPIQSGMAGIPTVAFYTKYPVKVFAASVMNEQQRVFLQGQGVEIDPNPEVRGSMNTVLTISSHVGTHIDAPRHFFETATPVDEIPLDRIVMREAVVLDVSHLPPGAAVQAEHLERTGVKPRRDQIAVIKTLWTNRTWGKPEFWTQMPYLAPSVGDWILDKQVAAVAQDCFPEIPWFRGVPLKPEERAINHKKWLGNGIIMIQFLMNLDQMGDRFTLIALPLRLKGMDGSPARVVGIKM
ncbi:MAG: cyclase family protein [Deltaproteobacteria bacterium]|nr:cyclase family protein [Deltaproteobacteria bacterium]